MSAALEPVDIPIDVELEPAPTLDLVRPSEWDSSDLVIEDFDPRGWGSYRVSAARLRLMDDNEFRLFFEEATGFCAGEE